MPRFAIYYVPQAEDAFYRLGTSIVGYDVRARTTATMPPDLQLQIGQFDTSWTGLSQKFGFHLTICDALDCEWSTIPRVERELAELLACFDPAHPFTLRKQDNVPVGIWGEAGRNTLVLLYEPNTYFSMLHTLIVARINPLGTGSVYLRRYLDHPEKIQQPHRAQQLRLFHSATVLDNWYPHFTLLNPYSGGEPAAMASLLARLFEPYVQLTIRSVCLLVQMDNETKWHIYREFLRPTDHSQTG